MAARAARAAGAAHRRMKPAARARWDVNAGRPDVYRETRDLPRAHRDRGFVQPRLPDLLRGFPRVRARVKPRPLAELRARIDGVIARKGKIEILQLSGGEPTLHPQFFELLAWAQAHEKSTWSWSTPMGEDRAGRRVSGRHAPPPRRARACSFTCNTTDRRRMASGISVAATSARCANARSTAAAGSACRSRSR